MTKMKTGCKKNVIQTTEGRKNLVYIYVDVFEILRRFAPLNDKRN